MVRGRVVVGVVVLFGALALSGCSAGSADSGGGGAPTSAADAPAPTSPDSLAPDAPAPAGLTCAQVGGVFEAHGTDGRGDCEPADKRRKCHGTSDDGNAITELTMTPPFPNGTIDNPSEISSASNRDCWKLPAGS